MRGHGLRGKKRDDNEREIIKELRKIGVKVRQLDDPLDLLCGWRGVIFLIEVKDGAKPPSAQYLTKNEADFMEEWDGYPIGVCNSVDGAIQFAQHVTMPWRTK